MLKSGMSRHGSADETLPRIARQYDRREGHPVSTREFDEIWLDQCDATDEIKLRYGVKAAFDYLVD